MRNVTLGRYIQIAYHVRSDQIVGPKWVETERYDLEAKADHPTTDGELRVMIQNLLQERLRMELHHDIRQQPGYELWIDPNGKATTRVPGADKYQRPTVTVSPGGVHTFENAPVEYLAYYLSRELGQTVINKVGYTGTYNFVLTWTSGPMQVAHFGVPETVDVENSGPTIFDAVKTIALKLVGAKVPVDYLVIDHIEKLPIEK
jgi:uncharacterized protein (TIGR03435 family)